jgi:hypothetical protein
MKPTTLILISSALILPAAGEGVRGFLQPDGGGTWSERARTYFPAAVVPMKIDTVEIVPAEPAFELSALSANPADISIFEKKQQLGAGASTVAGRTVSVAKSFLGVPYGDGGVDDPAEEELIVNLRRLNCWTLVEYSLAIGLTGTEGDYETFAKHVQDLRYWGGEIDGYGSRIHYFTGWLLQAEKLGLVRNVTPSLGGIPYRKQVQFMSKRPRRYPKIRDLSTLEAIRKSEQRISRHAWTYIPKSRVASIERRIQDGDIVLLTSGKKDLDVAHAGIAVRRNGRIHLVHASSLGKRVVVSYQPLAKYLAAQRGQTGIMVARIAK